jgi:hypothetical protein
MVRLRLRVHDVAVSLVSEIVSDRDSRAGSVEQAPAASRSCCSLPTKAVTWGKRHRGRSSPLHAPAHVSSRLACGGSGEHRQQIADTNEAPGKSSKRCTATLP